MLDHIYQIIERRSQFASRRRKSSMTLSGVGGSEEMMTKLTDRDLTKVHSKTKKVEPGTYESPNRGVLPREHYMDFMETHKVFSPSGTGRMALR